MKMKQAEGEVYSKISKERENRKKIILAETDQNDFFALEEENEDETIRNFVRAKNVQRKLLVTTRFWYY